MKTPNVDRSVIEVRVREVAQLFNSLDPSPFRERDLDTDAEDFIVSWARELPQNDELQIVIHLPDAQVRQAHCAPPVDSSRAAITPSAVNPMNVPPNNIAEKHMPMGFTHSILIMTPTASAKQANA